MAIQKEDIARYEEEEKKLRKQINTRRNKINAYKKKIEKDRVHKMCEVAGFLFTEIADWKGEQYNDYVNLDLERFKRFCLNNKDAIKSALTGPNNPQEQASNSPNTGFSQQKGTYTQPNYAVERETY